MSFLSSNNYLYHGYGGLNDIKMTVRDYDDMINCLEEENLSKKMTMKFKRASQSNCSYLTSSLIATFGVSFALARWSTSPFYQGIHRNKAVLPICGVLCYWNWWTRMQRPLKRRLYTEILTEDSQDGTYIRESIR